MSGGRERRLEEDLYPPASFPRWDEVGGTKAVILAGGKGTRLKPYTSVLPKPLMKLGDRAILELVVHQLAQKASSTSRSPSAISLI